MYSVVLFGNNKAKIRWVWTGCGGRMVCDRQVWQRERSAVHVLDFWTVRCHDIKRKLFFCNFEFPSKYCLFSVPSLLLTFNDSLIPRRGWAAVKGGMFLRSVNAAWHKHGVRHDNDHSWQFGKTTLNRSGIRLVYSGFNLEYFVSKSGWMFQCKSTRDLHQCTAYSRVKT